MDGKPPGNCWLPLLHLPLHSFCTFLSFHAAQIAQDKIHVVIAVTVFAILRGSLPVAVFEKQQQQQLASIVPKSALKCFSKSTMFSFPDFGWDCLSPPNNEKPQ